MLRSLALTLSLPALAIAQGWVDKTPAGILQTPSPRAFPAMCWDQAHGYVILFGGLPINGGGAPNETWTWNGTQWTRRLTTNPPYNGYSQYNPRTTAMTFHAPTNEVVMVHDGATWIWSGTDWLLHPAVVPGGSGGAAGNLALAHDPVHNQSVLYIGTRGSGVGLTFVSQTFTWDGLAWTQRTTPTSPFPCENATLAFDPAVGRLVLATGSAGISAFHEWTGTNWQQRFPANTPTEVGAWATDNTNQRIVMLDGVFNGQPNHTWTYTNGVMQHLSSPLEPARRFGAAMAYDPIRQRTVLFGGAAIWNAPQNQFLCLGDTWEFQLPAAASYTAFGSGCAGSHGVPTLAASSGQAPRVGQPFQAVVTGLPLTGLAFVFVGLSNTSYGPTPLPLSLGLLGAPGCTLYCSGDDLNVIPNVLGTGLWQWNVPNAPGAVFYTQAFAFDAAANALGITSSNGATGVIGF